jgi:D-aminopeptidase
VWEYASWRNLILNIFTPSNLFTQIIPSTIFTAASTNWIEVWRCNSTELHQSSGATMQKLIRAAVQKAYQSSGAKSLSEQRCKKLIRAAVQKAYQSSGTKRLSEQRSKKLIRAAVQKFIRAAVQKAYQSSGAKSLSEQRCKKLIRAAVQKGYQNSGAKSLS